MNTLMELVEVYRLPWLLLALVSWGILFVYQGKRSFWQGLPLGIWTSVVGGVLENFFVKHKFWAEEYILVKIGQIDLFVIIGPFLVIGWMLIRHLPEQPIGRILAVFSWSMFATFVEYVAIKLGFLSYEPGRWTYLLSIMAYSLALFSTLGVYFAFLSDRFSCPYK